MSKPKAGAASRRAARRKEARVWPRTGLTTAEYVKAYYQKNYPAWPDMHLEFVIGPK